jgi:hypothetical protein
MSIQILKWQIAPRREARTISEDQDRLADMIPADIHIDHVLLSVRIAIEHLDKP